MCNISETWKENKGTAPKEQDNVSYQRYSVMEVPGLEREVDFPFYVFHFSEKHFASYVK